MADFSNSRSGFLTPGGSVDSSSGPVSLPAYLPSSPHYIHQSSKDRQSSTSPSQFSHQSSTEKISPQVSRHSSRERISPTQQVTPHSSRERLSHESSRERLPLVSDYPQQPSYSRPGLSIAGSSEWSPSLPRHLVGCSIASLDNARYAVGEYPRQEHENEDRHFCLDKGTYQVFGVFDGHDGSRAVGFTSNYFAEMFDMPSIKKVVESSGLVDSDVPSVETVLAEFFKSAEKEFFKSIEMEIEHKEVYTALIPEGMTSYQAQQEYPYEVAELQRLESKITGGCTAVVAIIANKKLYVANVGDSRAILIRERSHDGTLYAEQLSVDHCVDNEEELSRLEVLGLSKENLKRAGRLGTQENTRSIGDYYIKRGYKYVDTLISAREPPGIAIPHIATPVPVDNNLRYLVLMTDGIYKCIEGQFDDKYAIDANKVLTHTIQRSDKPGSDPGILADEVVSRISKIHHDTYQEAAAKDPRSTKAVNCRKRDDMTCVIYKFPPKAAPRRSRRVDSTDRQPHSV